MNGGMNLLPHIFAQAMIVCGVACCCVLFAARYRLQSPLTSSPLCPGKKYLPMKNLLRWCWSTLVTPIRKKKYYFMCSWSNFRIGEIWGFTPNAPTVYTHNAHASVKEVSPATLPQKPIQIGRAMYFTAIFTKLFIPGQSFILQHKTMYVRIPEDLFCKCSATKIQDMHIEVRSVQLMPEYRL